MKKYLLTLFSVLVSVTLMGQTSFTIYSNNPNYSITYNVTSENTVSIKVNYMNGNDIHFTIPETVTGNQGSYDGKVYNVTAIADNGFQYITSVKRVTIPSTITSMGNNAFQGSGLTSIEIPNNITTIPDNAFQNCNNLESVIIGSNVTSIGDNAFANCGNLKSVTINCDNLSTIGNNAFYQCDDLLSIFIPGTVTSVGSSAFQGCGALHEVRFGAPTSDDLSITLGANMFKECHSMHSITLPKNLTTIPDGLLASCHNFNEIIVPEGVTYVGAAAFENTHDCEIIFLGCGSDGVITIHSTAFQNCHDEDIEFLCLSTSGVDIVSENGNNINWGNNVRMHVPCGMSSLYQDEATQGSNIVIDETNCISVSKQSGQFCLPETWIGYDSWILTTDASGYLSKNTYAEKEEWLQTNGYPYFVPREADHPFYIQEVHKVCLHHSRHIYPFNSINKGVLIVDAPEGGQLIERDSIIFNGLYQLDVEYKVTKEENKYYITRNGHDKTEITSLMAANAGDGLTSGDYEVDRTFLRDKATHYKIISLANLRNDLGTDNEKIITDMLDYDYYEKDGDVLYYYGPHTSYGGGASWNVLNDRDDYPENTLLENINPGLYKYGEDCVMHVMRLDANNKAVVKIDKTTANVTLRGTDYAYGHVKMHENLGGEIEIIVRTKGNAWNFVGAPFKGYDLWGLKLGPGNTDATVVEFDYEKNDWSMNYSYADDEIGAGEGLFVWPFYNDSIVFSTVRDRSIPSGQKQSKVLEKDFLLNNDDVVVTKTISDDPNIANNTKGRWMALSNPYPAKLCVNSFIKDNTSNIATQDIVTQIQGQGVYVLKYNGEVQDWQFKPKTADDASDAAKYDIGVGEGFFINVKSSGENIITFKKNQLHEYDESTCVHEGHTHSAKAVEKEFIRFAMIEGERESEVLFAHNQDAQEGYDIFDANKLFAMSHIAEPYFVVDGISLVKEEVNLLPYYATMNVKSFGNKEVKFRPNYIPEGLSVTLIDGEESIDLLQGQEYATEISAGENANRFKLLIKKSLGLSDAEELEVNISNDNRIVNIATSETDLQIEVYNALGQKVFETKALNFSLNNVSAGAYMIKAFNNKASKTQKIVVK